MAGYINGTKVYWYNRGYAEGNNKLPMSSHNVNYTDGYTQATGELAQFGKLGTIPAHNQGDFYLGVEQGADHTDEQIDKSGIGQWSLCPPGHTTEYCAGFNFGANWEGYARDLPTSHIFTY
jgi:hypothetical protein